MENEKLAANYTIRPATRLFMVDSQLESGSPPPGTFPCLAQSPRPDIDKNKSV